jgi:hypothetical protein
MHVDAFIKHQKKGSGKGGGAGHGGKGDKNFEGACDVCGKIGHRASECWYKQGSAGGENGVKGKGKDEDKGKSKGKGKDKEKPKGKGKAELGKGVGAFGGGWQEGDGRQGWQERPGWREGGAQEPEPADVKSLDLGTLVPTGLSEGAHFVPTGSSEGARLVPTGSSEGPHAVANLASLSDAGRKRYGVNVKYDSGAAVTALPKSFAEDSVGRAVAGL